MANKPNWLEEKISGVSGTRKRSNKTENSHMLALLLKIFEYNKNKNNPASDYSLRYIATDVTRRIYLSKMHDMRWIFWQEESKLDGKKSGWVPDKNGKTVLKTIIKLQDEVPQNPLLGLETFLELGYIDRGLV